MSGGLFYTKRDSSGRVLCGECNEVISGPMLVEARGPKKLTVCGKCSTAEKEKRAIEARERAEREERERLESERRAAAAAREIAQAPLLTENPCR